jgi:hypothetical protein
MTARVIPKAPSGCAERNSGAALLKYFAAKL